MKVLASLLRHALTLAAGIILTLIILPYLPSEPTPSTTSTLAPTPIPDVVVPVTLSEQEAIFAELYDALASSVVSITLGARLENDFVYTPVASGSGFAISESGYIVTNAHVVRVPPDVQELFDEVDAQIEDMRVEVSMYDGTISEAEIIGTDSDSDIAVIQVDVAEGVLPPVTFGDSSNLRVGQTVLAIGNPFSNDWTMTSGIISALNRSMVGLEGFSIGGVIQTDTAINPGNSGGPLINLDGEVIGVNSQINTESGANTGIGFAVPSNLVNIIAQSLINNGEVAYSFIGIQSRPVDLDLMNAFDLPNNLRGVAVLIAFDDMPASEGGLQSLSNSSVDVITAINGQAVADFDELIGYLAINTVPGDTVMLTVYRNGDYLEIPVTLTNRPALDEEVENAESEQ